jgi:SPP1 family predicted phage head-tail adaptor
MADKNDIGSLDREITIQTPKVAVSSTYKKATEVYSDWLVGAWANVRPLSMRELAEAKQISAEADTRFQIRWVPGLKTSMRIVFEGRFYDIYAIIEVGRRDRVNIFGKARHK